MKKIILFFCCLTVPFLAMSQNRIPSEQLLEEAALLKDALTTLHAGLYRYEDAATIEGYFQDLERAFQQDRTLAECYLIYSRFLARLKDGHTYANFWNQSETVQEVLFNNSDKLPFTFRLIEGRMLITQDVSEHGQLAGKEVRAINGVAVSAILDSLMQLVKGDGSNDAARMYSLELTGYEKFEPFDIFMPMGYPPVDGQYSLLVADPLTSGAPQTVQVNTLSRMERAERLEAQFGPQAQRPDDLWKLELLDDTTAYLQLGSFVTWKMDLDWKNFLKKAFAEMKKQRTRHLILDIRGNGGGTTEVYTTVLEYLLKEPIELNAFKDRVVYERVPERLLPYLGTWDESIKDLSSMVVPAEPGFYQLKKERIKTLKPRKDAFDGRVSLLVDAANSSATFYLAHYAKAHQLATLYGSPTGGNLRGTTGGMLFFMNLPNSGIEIDLPLIASFPTASQPDQGIEPDVVIKRTVEGLLERRDEVLEVIKKKDR